MKPLVPLLLLALLAGASAPAAPPAARGAKPPGDGAAVAAVCPGVLRIVATSYGFKVETSSGVSRAYRTSYGYRFDGGPAGGLLLYRNSLGFTAQSARARAAACRARR